MAILGLKCTPDELVWVSLDDSDPADVRLSKGKFKMRDQQPIAQRLDSAMASLDTLIDRLKDEGQLDAVGLRLTEPASFKGPGGVKQGSLNKLYLEGCVQRQLASRGIAFDPLIENQIKAAFGTKKKVKVRLGEDPFEGVPGTAALKEQELIALAVAIAARKRA